MTINKEAIIQAIKEVGRLAFFAALGAIVLWLSTLVSNYDPTSLQVVILTAVGRFLDKYIHENEDIKANGIAPF